MPELLHQPQAVSLPDLGKPIPCDDVATMLGEGVCATVAALRVTYRHEDRDGTRTESWTICEACFFAMREHFAGTVLDIHPL